MLTFNLKKTWFEKIKSGEKTHEYREVKPYWTTRIFNEIARCASEGQRGFDILFVNGYNYSDTLKAKGLYIDELPNGLHTDLKTDKPVYDILFQVI